MTLYASDQWGIAYKITKKEDQEVALTVCLFFMQKVLLFYPFSKWKIIKYMSFQLFKWIWDFELRNLCLHERENSKIHAFVR